MPIIVNHHHSALTLPNGDTVPKDGSINVDDEAWEVAKKHPVVKSWLQVGALKLESGKPADDGKKAADDPKKSDGKPADDGKK